MPLPPRNIHLISPKLISPLTVKNTVLKKLKKKRRRSRAVRQQLLTLMLW